MSEQRQTDTLSHPRLAGDAFPLAPHSVINAYQYYWQVTHEQHQTAREVRMAEVNSIVGDFCDSFIQAPVYSAAMLMPIMDKLADPLTSRNAYRALRVYLDQSDAGEKDDRYTFGMLSDRLEIATFWRESIAMIRADYPEISPSLGDEMSEVEISKEQWQHTPRLLHPDKMVDLLERVNLESILIQSAELLQWLTSERAGNNGETFSYMYAAESIFAPICEIVGFHGLKMALQSRCDVLRFHFRGKPEFVAQAEALLESMGTHESIEQSIHNMFEATIGDTIHEQVLRHSSPHNILISEGITEDNTRVIWREKTIGSLAKKLARNGIDSEPMDIFGTTLICDSEESLASAFAKMINKIEAADNITLKPSTSRNHAVHVRGDEAYIQTIREALGYSTLDDMKEHVDVKTGPSDGFRVAKVTFMYDETDRTPMPFEIQFCTEQDRMQARIGAAAHLLFKFTDARAIVDPQTLEAIRNRKASIGHNDLVGPSQARADALMGIVRNTSL